MPHDPEGLERNASRRLPTWALLRWPAVAVLLILGLLLAAPGRAPAERGPGAAPTAALAPDECRSEALLLPPGHPPVAGMTGDGHRLGLPPGHPPIDGRASGLRRPLPVFAPPEVVDL